MAVLIMKRLLLYDKPLTGDILPDGIMISIFPNPAADKLNIQNASSKIKKIEIYDVMGQIVFQQKITS